MKRSRYLCLWACILAFWLASAGCSLIPGGQSQLVLRNRDAAGGGDGAEATSVGRFDTAVYARHSAHEVTFVLWDGAEGDATQQAAVVRVLWRPRAGSTPLGSDATNATLTYAVLTNAGEGGGEGGGKGGGESGGGVIWTGGGFVGLRGKPGDDTLSGSVWSGDLSPLVAAGPKQGDETNGGSASTFPRRATLRGSFTATRDDAATLALIRRLDRLASRRLGTPVLVMR